ncbi:MAG: tetratricopeptide repeat protein [Pseudomonadota bacterium]
MRLSGNSIALSPTFIATLSAAVALSCVVLSGPANARTSESIKPLRSLAGSYLAGRFARSQHDTASAAAFYRNALFRDRKSPVLVEQSFLMEASEGNWQAAELLAKRLVEIQDNHRMARMFLGLTAFKEQNYLDAEKHFQKADSGPIGELTSSIARSWIALARGQKERSLRLLKLPQQAEWAQFYLRYHRGLVADQAGNKEQARLAFNQVFRQDNRTLRTALAYAHHLANAGKSKAAQGVLRAHLKQSRGDGHPLAKDLLARIQNGEKAGLLIKSPSEGLAEVFYGLGEALTGEGGVSIGLLYLQMALYLEPNQSFALAALANAHETTKRYDAAISTYKRIPTDTPLRSAIEIRKAFNLNSLGNTDGAQKVLEEVAARDPKDIKPLDALGNIMRSKKRYEEAIAYYSRAIDLIDKPDRRHWSFYYSRGTCYERTKNWPKAEKDLKKALELFPDQPLALNYLGYSWIDQNKNLKQGMKLIEKAVALKPDDGYIVDSLGWAHYKLRDYAKAVKYLERAVELRPDDPILNDHLGDALWRIGREREARFQWDLSVSLNPEPEDLLKIRKKIATGLPEKRQANAAIDDDAAFDGPVVDGPPSPGEADTVNAKPKEDMPLPSRPATAE